MIALAAATAVALNPVAVGSYAEGLRANFADHLAERKLSESLGYRRAAAAVPVDVQTVAHRVELASLGMGSNCPFSSEELVFETLNPIFTPAECAAVREEAAASIQQGASSTFTMTSTNRDVAVHDLPKTLRWLTDGALARVTSLAASCFPSAIVDAESLWIYRGLVINYDAAAGLTHQPIHRDGALISCVVPLSPRTEYTGGGTYVEPLGTAFALEQGCALLHPSAIRHAGHRIERGERWVLVLFLNGVEMRQGEHGRRFRARAQEWFAALQEEAEEEAEEEDDDDEEEEEGEEEEEEEEIDGELNCLMHALTATDESDHEIWYDLGARAHDLGDPSEALELYKRACVLNERDALLLSNMGVALLELGRPCEAFRCYRRALAVDPHNVNARFNAGELLLELGKFQGLAALLASTCVPHGASHKSTQEHAGAH